ncbi:MAG: hypothetical protein R6X33_03545 [Candidatus Brocadiia bacterium]
MKGLSKWCFAAACVVAALLALPASVRTGSASELEPILQMEEADGGARAVRYIPREDRAEARARKIVEQALDAELRRMNAAQAARDAAQQQLSAAERQLEALTNRQGNIRSQISSLDQRLRTGGTVMDGTPYGAPSYETQMAIRSQISNLQSQLSDVNRNISSVQRGVSSRQAAYQTAAGNYQRCHQQYQRQFEREYGPELARQKELLREHEEAVLDETIEEAEIVPPGVADPTKARLLAEVAGRYEWIEADEPKGIVRFRIDGSVEDRQGHRTCTNRWEITSHGLTVRLAGEEWLFQGAVGEELRGLYQGPDSSRKGDRAVLRPAAEHDAAAPSAEERRRRIYWELLLAEDSADTLARQKSKADPDKWLETFYALEARCKARVRARYGITREQEREIIKEASGKDWPAPWRPVPAS